MARLFSQQDLLLLKSFEGGFNILLDYNFFGFLEYIWTLAGHSYTRDISLYWHGLSLCGLQEPQPRLLQPGGRVFPGFSCSYAECLQLLAVKQGPPGLGFGSVVEECYPVCDTPCVQCPAPPSKSLLGSLGRAYPTGASCLSQ